MSMASELLILRKEVKALRKEVEKLKARMQTQTQAQAQAQTHAPSANIDKLALALREHFAVDRNGHRMTLADIRQALANAGIILGDDRSAAISLGRALVRFGAWRRRSAQGWFYEGIRPRVNQEVEA